MRTRLLALALSILPLAAQEHVGQYSQAEIQRGLRLYGSNCALCHGVTGDTVPNVDLRSGKFRHAGSDDDLIRVISTGIPGSAMPPHKFEAADLTAVVAYVRSMRGARSTAGTGGDASRGRALFEGKGGCPGCHRVGAHGSRIAPDLSEIGIMREPAALERSLLDPTAAMLPVNRPIRAVTREGKVIAGRRLNEDSYSVQLIDSEERLLSLKKADLKEYTVSRVSTMPSFREKLSSQELADVIAYLLTLKGIE
jgi:putative heme-binding domain-containing protein